MKAPLLLQYAEADERINAGLPAYETALKAAEVNYRASLYPGVQHGFNNDATPRCDAAAEKLAWDRTLALAESQNPIGDRFMPGAKIHDRRIWVLLDACRRSR